MAGFLDKKERIVDMVLTNEGKWLLSRGELRFSYFVLFDDEVDYSPYISNSASLSQIELSASRRDQVETTLVREAVSGYVMGNSSGSDTTNVRSMLFTVPQGQRVLPRMTMTDGPTGSFTIETKVQRSEEVFYKVDQNGNILEKAGPFDRGCHRFDPSRQVFRMGIDGPFFDEGLREGFLVEVYASGAEGIFRLRDRLDAFNDISFDPDVKIVLED